MKKSKIHESFDVLQEQMKKLANCSKNEIEHEYKRSLGMSELSNAQAKYAELEARTFLAGGFLPENSLIAVPDDAKLLRKSNYAEAKKKPNLLDEFVKQ